MNKEFLEKKVRELSDKKLQDLLRLTNKANQQIVNLALVEAKSRGWETPQLLMSNEEDTVPEGKIENLNMWNWGAFLLAPLWTLTFKLEKWAILTFVPGVNIVVVIYLGFRGNRLAYKKSAVRNVDQFMKLQEHWCKSGIRLFLIWLAVAISFSIVSSVCR